ncbi:hypothetical protein KKI19_03985, partial [Patescibacteria group bacterium]|nr:hypothetical protein [Patescibacteria group bacterium]
LILIKDRGQIDLIIDSHRIRIFSISEILQALKEVGFKSKIYSNFQQLAYEKNSDIPVFVCQK